MDLAWGLWLAAFSQIENSRIYVPLSGNLILHLAIRLQMWDHTRLSGEWNELQEIQFFFSF